MPWKKDENGVLAADEKGNPVWVLSDGKEEGFDYSEYSAAKREAMERKEKIKALEAQLEPFKGIENPSEWLSSASKALETVAALPEKDKDREEQIRARVEAATKPLHEKLSAREKELQEAGERLNQLKVEDALNNLPHMAKIRQKDTVRALFRGNLGVDAEGVFVRDKDGKPQFGENGRMTPNEGLIEFVKNHPDGQHWLDGAGTTTGSGAQPSQAAKTTVKTMSRAQFDALDPGMKPKIMAEGVTLTD